MQYTGALGLRDRSEVVDAVPYYIASYVFGQYTIEVLFEKPALSTTMNQLYNKTVAIIDKWLL